MKSTELPIETNRLTYIKDLAIGPTVSTAAAVVKTSPLDFKVGQPLKPTLGLY